GHQGPAAGARHRRHRRARGHGRDDAFVRPGRVPDRDGFPVRLAHGVLRLADSHRAAGTGRRPRALRAGQREFAGGGPPRSALALGLTTALGVPVYRIERGGAASGFCSQAQAAPAASTSAEYASPRARPPGPSAIQPTALGPMICPAAKTMVNAAMPPDHSGAGRLCRTSAVVDATTERNTAPNSSPAA